MCGICGVFGPERLARTDLIEAMTRTIDHRGPDDSGLWQDHFQQAGEDRAIAFGHTRLSIIDLSPLGHQPMHSADGQITLVYNGEIYNFRELREELIGLGHRFRSESDSEVLIEAYRAWGIDALDRFVGMFAFALWDASSKRLVLARDRLGIKPLYWSYAEGLLLFGSELRCLRAHPGFRDEIGRDALGRFLQNGYVTGPETIYRHVQRLMPGHVLVLENGNLHDSTYWQLDAPPEHEAPTSFEAAVDGLEACLGEAVEQRLVSDVPIGAFLSGGIDSTAVAALMRERAGAGVRTFSIGFSDAAYDEAPHARAVANHLETDHTELYVERGDALEVAYELPDLFDEPFADSSAIPTTLLSRLTREHVTVALSGDGGDELLGGYDQYPKLAQLAPWMRIPRPLRQLGAAAASLKPDSSIARGLAHLSARDECELAERLVSHFPTKTIEDLCGSTGERPRYREAFEAPGDVGAARRSMHADAATYLPDDILTKVDRATMSTGLEARVPILDHRVVRFALSLPMNLVWHEGHRKAPLRELVLRRVPREIMDRPKQGFGIPVETLLAHELDSWTKTYLAPDRLSEEGLFDPQAVDRVVSSLDLKTSLGAQHLWFLLSFERWYSRVHRGEDLRPV